MSPPAKWSRRRSFAGDRSRRDPRLGCGRSFKRNANAVIIAAVCPGRSSRTCQVPSYLPPRKGAWHGQHDAKLARLVVHVRSARKPTPLPRASPLIEPCTANERTASNGSPNSQADGLTDRSFNMQTSISVEPSITVRPYPFLLARQVDQFDELEFASARRRGPLPARPARAEVLQA